MKFMILVKSNPELEARLEATSDADMKPSMVEMEAFNDELRKAGVMKDCDGLSLSKEGKRVHFNAASRTVVDGPFQGIWSPTPGRAWPQSSRRRLLYCC